MLALQTGLVHLAQAGGGDRRVGKLLKQFLCRRTEFLADASQGGGMGKGRQIVLQACQFLQPVPTHQIRSGGEGLSQLDEAGPQTRQGVENATRQPLLNGGVIAASTQQQHQHQPRQGPQHLNKARNGDPGTQQQPAEIPPGVVTHRIALSTERDFKEIRGI